MVVLQRYLVLLLCCGFGQSLRITDFHVPQFVHRKDSVALECRFEMSDPSETLHTIKWYKINAKGHMEEFFSFKPNKGQPRVNELPGVKVDLRQSNLTQVMLRKVSISSTGLYRCEVTAKNSPRFESQFAEDRMFVLELPEQSPDISGGLHSYQIGDRLELNCTSPRTYPPTVLKWYINGKLYDSATNNVKRKVGSKHGLYRSQISLNITVSRNLFHYGRIRIKCIGIIEDGILHGISDGSSHQIETILLPEAWKREKPVEFVVPLINASEKLSRNFATLYCYTLVALLVTLWLCCDN